MKRKLRPWVKVSAGVLGMTLLSAAASCQNGTVSALQNHPADTAPEAVTKTAAPEKTARYEASRAQKDGEGLLLVPKLLKEVADI